MSIFHKLYAPEKLLSSSGKEHISFTVKYLEIKNFSQTENDYNDVVVFLFKKLWLLKPDFFTDSLFYLASVSEENIISYTDPDNIVQIKIPIEFSRMDNWFETKKAKVVLNGEEVFSQKVGGFLFDSKLMVPSLNEMFLETVRDLYNNRFYLNKFVFEIKDDFGNKSITEVGLPHFKRNEYNPKDMSVVFLDKTNYFYKTNDDITKMSCVIDESDKLILISDRILELSIRVEKIK